MNYRVLVPIKRVIDYRAKIRVKSDFSGVEQNGMKMSMNPFCEIAVEEAIRLKEQKKIKEITAMSIGPKKSEEILRTALAMGVDKAIHINTDMAIDNQLQPIHVSHILHQIIQKNNYDFCIMGK